MYKKINAPVIEQFTGVEHYRAKKEQIKRVMQFITSENYMLMKKRVCLKSINDNEKNSSNFDQLAIYLESDNDSWIVDINNMLDE